MSTIAWLIETIKSSAYFGLDSIDRTWNLNNWMALNYDNNHIAMLKIQRIAKYVVKSYDTSV